MRLLSITAVVLAGSLLSGCYHQPPRPVARGSLIGDYVYHCGDSGAPHAPDRLTLRADGTYVLVRMDDGHPGGAENGTWRLYNNPPGGGRPEVAFGGRWYPIEIKGRRVRLLINEDLSHSYQKID